jgi:hypothetical protein
MPSIGDRVAKVTFLRVFSDLPNRGDAQGARARLLEIVPHEFDDSEQLIADVRVFAGQQPGQLVQASVAPHPTVQREGHAGAAADGDGKERKARPVRCLTQAVEHEQREKCDQDPRDGSADRLDRLNRPDQPAEVVQLSLQLLRQLQTIVRSNKAHRTLLDIAAVPRIAADTLTEPCDDFSM